MSRRNSKNPPPQFHVGDLVRSRNFPDGGVFEIVEDHGNIGYGGRRFYTLKTMEKEPDTFAFPEEELEAVARARNSDDASSVRNA